MRFAPWYYLVGWLAPLALCMFAFVSYSAEPPPEEQSVADNLVSDRPLEAGDPDPLNFNTIASGLSRFLRNEKTRPPLTIAITGEWGSGKSSLMNLLKADLMQRRFRPVWFNAWHHQQEEQLLAALLEHVRRQSVPPWWEWQGLQFRARLLRLRDWRYRVFLVFLLAVLAFSLGYFNHTPLSLGEVLLQAQGWIKEGGKWLSSIATGTVSQSSSPPQETIPTSSTQPQLLLVLSSVVAILITLYKNVTAFGVNPATLLASLSDNARVRDLGAQVSFRQKFAAEFRDVTKALHPRTMLILIDDLDRCRPEKVLEVLEAINFLVSSGECYIVMGMALERVERCVGLGFKDVAEELLDDQPQDAATSEKKEEGKKKRAAFARQYLEKLINIEVPVPTLTQEQSAHLLNADRHAAPEQNSQRFRALFTRATAKRLAPWAALLLLLSGSFWSGFRIENAPPPQAKPTTPVPEPGSPQLTPAPQEKETQVPKEKEQPTSEAVFISGQQSHPSPWLPLAPVAMGIAAWLWFSLRKQEELVVKDSPEFVDALKIWLPLVTVRQNTPRSIKRFLNRVRYLAMRQRAQKQQERTIVAAQTNGKPTANGKAMPESLLVALSAVQQAYPEWVTTNGSFLEKVKELGRELAEQQTLNGNFPPNLLRNSTLFNDAWAAHEERFHNLDDADSFWPIFIEISKGVRVRS